GTQTRGRERPAPDRHRHSAFRFSNGILAGPGDSAPAHVATALRARTASGAGARPPRCSENVKVRRQSSRPQGVTQAILSPVVLSCLVAQVILSPAGSSLHNF